MANIKAKIEKTETGDIITLKDGRKIKVAAPTGEVLLDGMRIAGENFSMVVVCQALQCVKFIDDKPIAPVHSLAMVRKLSNELGYGGTQVMMSWLQQYMEIIDTDEGREELKNE